MAITTRIQLRPTISLYRLSGLLHSVSVFSKTGNTVGLGSILAVEDMVTRRHHDEANGTEAGAHHADRRRATRKYVHFAHFRPCLNPP